MRSATRVLFPAPGVVSVTSDDVPDPGADQILCAASTSLISIGTELACLAGHFDTRTFWSEWVSYPFTPGYCMVSVVEAAGSDTSFVPGERVFTFTPHVSQFVCAAAEAVRIPDAVSDANAAWSSLAVTTQWAMRRSGFVFGENAMVVGLGPLGQLLVQYLRLAGARRIMAVDADASRVGLAEAHGATEVFVGDVGSLVGTHHGTCDVVFDVTGHAAVLAPASELVRRLGRLVLVGDAPQPSMQYLGPRIVADGISVIGVHAGTATNSATNSDPWSTPAMLELFYAYVTDGRIRLEALSTDVVRPSDIPEMYRTLRNNRQAHLGVTIDWSKL